MDAEAVAIALDLKRAGKGWRGPCPCCGGSGRAGKFSLSENRAGRLLWHCFAGCGQDDIRAVLVDRGLLDRERENKPRPRWSRDEAETAAYLLLAADAALRAGDPAADRPENMAALLRAALVVREAGPSAAVDLAREAVAGKRLRDYIARGLAHE